MTKTNKELRTELLQLLTEYPDLPVFCTVDEEVVTGDFTTYLADIYSVYKTEYVQLGDKFYQDADEAEDAWVDDNFMDFPEDTSEEVLYAKAHEVVAPMVKECIIIHISN